MSGCVHKVDSWQESAIALDSLAEYMERSYATDTTLQIWCLTAYVLL